MKTAAKSAEASSGEGCLLVVVALSSIPLGIALKSAVFMLLWEWLAVPAFGLPAITFPQALVVKFLAWTFAPPPPPQDGDSTAERCRSILIRAFAVPLFFLAAGWIIRPFIH